jgi:HTH-like domain
MVASGTRYLTSSMAAVLFQRSKVAITDRWMTGASFQKWRLRDRLLCQGQPYELLQTEKINYPIALMCKILKLARSGYYAWCKRQNSPRKQENAVLSEQIKEIHQSSHQTYGSPRIHAALIAKGFRIGRQRVVRLMARLSIYAHSKRKFKVTTEF